MQCNANTSTALLSIGDLRQPRQNATFYLGALDCSYGPRSATSSVLTVGIPVQSSVR
jgi:hypothetical protein